MDEEELEESIIYLEELLDEYMKLVKNIGHNGLSASLICNYRDEIQILMRELRMADADLRKYWSKIVATDDTLRKRAQAFVEEVGHENFKQYQIVNDPPRENWWWYLNRTTIAPPPEKKEWWPWKR